MPFRVDNFLCMEQRFTFSNQNLQMFLTLIAIEVFKNKKKIKSIKQKTKLKDHERWQMEKDAPGRDKLMGLGLRVSTSVIVSRRTTKDNLDQSTASNPSVSPQVR